MKKKLLAMSVVAAISSQANAFQFDTGDDWQIRWDNTFKFNAMSRLNKADDQVTQRATGSWLADDADLSVDRSGLGLVSTRFDVLSELDVIWKDNFGFRISGSGWYDPQYEESENDHPSDRNFTWSSPSANVGDYNHEAKDLHYAGGELLDAFVFANFDIGDTALGMRAGRHTIYWGNSLLATGAVASVGGAMAPLDFAKALSVPGSEAKELFMPSNKFSTVLQVTDNLTLNGYYSFEHQRYRLPSNGTFFSPAEGLEADGEFTTFPPPVPFGIPGPSTAVVAGYDNFADADEDEEWGFNVQYYVESWNLETSFIYLNYVDKNLHGLSAASDFGQYLSWLGDATGSPTAKGLEAAWGATCGADPAIDLGQDPYACPTALGTPYGSSNALNIGKARWLMKEDNDLWAISFAKEIAGISFGLDLVYRPDSPLAPDLANGLFRSYNVPSLPKELAAAGVPESVLENPDALAAALNSSVYGYGGDFSDFDSDNYLGPVGDVYTVVFNGVGLLNNNLGLWEGGSFIFEITAVMLDDCTDDCQLLDFRVSEDRVVTHVGGVFRPTWYQVWPGTDMTIPMAVGYTIDGEKSPFTFGGDEERGSATIGAEFLIDQKWTVTARYNTFFGPVNAGIGGLLKDRDNLSFTVKRTF